MEVNNNIDVNGEHWGRGGYWEMCANKGLVDQELVAI